MEISPMTKITELLTSKGCSVEDTTTVLLVLVGFFGWKDVNNPKVYSGNREELIRLLLAYLNWTDDSIKNVEAHRVREVLAKISLGD